MINQSPHQFHIPVMGISFTIDTPIKVARFGISSVISIVQDNLIETMRKHYYKVPGKSFTPITNQEDDYRAKRITDYLNLVKQIVDNQLCDLRKEPFEPGSEINKYFEMLPEDSDLKRIFRNMLASNDKQEQKAMQDVLRSGIIAGSIDVNIMTKVDRELFTREGNIVKDGSEAVAALRGYANSELTNSSVIFSAGLNPRLYNYLETTDAFDPDENMQFRKKVAVKVSDYRSALIQGKYLAKKGIWVSEFRIESGLNCGGHAFASDGFLLGPILEEFKQNRRALTEELFEIYQKVISKKMNRVCTSIPPLSITVQGGIGTNEEQEMLLQKFNIDRTGWGTPFLLVPEATTVDKQTLNLLKEAKDHDISLSKNSPLGVRFYYLHGTTSEEEKLARISAGKPGSPCTEKHLAFNTEFTEEPICTASIKYQELKLNELDQLDLPSYEFAKRRQDILDKECLCIGLSNSAPLVFDVPFVKNLNSVTICPGPNIVNFSEELSLQAMTDHIYGRTNVITNPQRPHMFIAELMLYINYVSEKITDWMPEDMKGQKAIQSSIKNLLDGIDYYKNSARHLVADQASFFSELDRCTNRLNTLANEFPIQPIIQYTNG